MDRRFSAPAQRPEGARTNASAATPRSVRAALPSDRSPFGIAGLLAIALVIVGVVVSNASAPTDGIVVAPRLATASLEYGTATLEPMPTGASRYQTMRQDLEDLPVPQIDAGDLLLLSDCDSLGPQPTGPNGRLPDSALCQYRNVKARADAAEALAQMDRAFKARFGDGMCLGNAYRSYDQQASMHASRPRMVAKPGRSNHGLGLAVDFCGANQQRGTAEYTWMLNNAPSFGWILPDWARPGGSKPEPWHWEFTGVGRRG